LLYTLSGVLRGAGNGSLAMKSLAVANIANMILDPIFIFGLLLIPAFGVVGAAIATTLGRAMGVVYQLKQLSNGRSAIQLNINYLRPNFELIKQLSVLASSTMGQFLIGSASWIFYVRILSELGSDVVAGYTIGMRTLIFAIMPAWGLANAAATLVGQNLGADQPERAAQSAWKAAFYNLVFLTAVAVVFISFAPTIVGWFTADANVLASGILCLRVVSLGYPCYAYGMVIGQSLNGAGDTLSPTLVNIFTFWLIGIPLAYFLSSRYQGLGVYAAIVFSETLLAIISVMVFRAGRWRRVKI
jgi:putative MATE family efflux protein